MSIMPGKFRPFRIEMELATPVALSRERGLHPLTHFDGLLLHVMAVLKLPPEARASHKAVLALAGELPLSKSGKEKEYYHASAAQLPKAAVARDAAVLSNSWKHWLGGYAEAFAKNKGEFWNEGSGIYRGARSNYLLAVASVAVFHAYGDMDAVCSLLEEYHEMYGLALGARVGTGNGQVAAFRAIPEDEDCSVWSGDGNAARYIPLEETPPERARGQWRARAAYRPPYWLTPLAACIGPHPATWMPLMAAGAGMVWGTEEEYLKAMGID